QKAALVLEDAKQPIFPPGERLFELRIQLDAVAWVLRSGGRAEQLAARVEQGDLDRARRLRLARGTQEVGRRVALAGAAEQSPKEVEHARHLRLATDSTRVRFWGSYRAFFPSQAG